MPKTERRKPMCDHQFDARFDGVQRVRCRCCMQWGVVRVSDGKAVPLSRHALRRWLQADTRAELSDLTWASANGYALRGFYEGWGL